MDRALLADAVHAADALHQAHGIPREVVVHESVRELKIATLAARLRREQDPGGAFEGANGGVLLGAAQRTSAIGERLARLAQHPGQILLGRTEPGEDQKLVRPCAHQAEEGAALGVVADRARLLVEPPQLLEEGSRARPVDEALQRRGGGPGARTQLHLDGLCHDPGDLATRPAALTEELRQLGVQRLLD